MTWETWILISMLTVGVVGIVAVLAEDWRAARRPDTQYPPPDRGVLKLKTLDGGYLEIPFRTSRVTSHRGR